MNGVTETTPTQANEQDLWERLNRLDDQLGKLPYPTGTIKPWKHNSEGALPVLAEMLALINGWLAAFRECDNLEGPTVFAMAQIDQWVTTLHLSMNQVKAAMDASMGYEPSNYAFGH